MFELESRPAEVVVTKGHGRLKRREVRASGELVRYSEFPGLAQAAQIKKRVVFRITGEVKESTHFLIHQHGPVLG